MGGQIHIATLLFDLDDFDDSRARAGQE
jgi:hypothetical protein